MKLSLRCTGCGREFKPHIYCCPSGDGILEVVYDLKECSSLEDYKTDLPGIWSYGGLLPDLEPVTLFEGGSPLIESSFLGHELGIELDFKDEGRSLTGSFKDRAASVMLSVEKNFDHQTVITASSGNAAGAVAAYSAAAGLDCYIVMFEPSREKLIAAQSFKPTVFVIETEIESEVLRLARDASREFGWEMLNTAASDNPYVIEGYKTIIFELYEQKKMPDLIFAPVGSGSLLIGTL